MDQIVALTKRRGLIRVDHGRHGSKARLWLEPEVERLMGLSGGSTRAIETDVRPFLCIICDRPSALASLSCREERKEMGAEWLATQQSHTEIAGILICGICRVIHPKLRIDSYKVSGSVKGECLCTWDGVHLFNCGVCQARNRSLMSSRSIWESLRILKPLGLFQDEILSGFTRHPYMGMREYERKAFLDARIPILPADGVEIRKRAGLEREKYVKDIKSLDRKGDRALTDSESMRWNLALWHQPIERCFPEVDLRQGDRAKLGWVYVQSDGHWQVRTWSSVAKEQALGGGWKLNPPYDLDYRGIQPRSNVTKEKRRSTRREKFVTLIVAPVKDVDQHLAWCKNSETFVKGVPYYEGQVVAEPDELFSVVLHFKANTLKCAHPDYDWLGGIEVEIHTSQPEVKVVKEGFLRRTRRLVTGTPKV